MSDYTLPLDAFIRAIGVDRQVPHAIFLGAGASISSGIPSAESCIWEWKRNIFLTNNPGLEKQFSELSLKSVRDRIQNWLDLKGTYPRQGSIKEYSFFIEQCYPISQHRRQFFAEKIKSAQPHIGYKLLCLMAQAEIIRSVWTTNFDGLVAKAASSFDIVPIEIGIDTQNRAYRQPRRDELPCVSMHGDYRYDELKNTDEELKNQEVGLRSALMDTVQESSLIVVGYSGRDESIMRTLEEAFSSPGISSLYWCDFGDTIDEPVLKLIETARANKRIAHFIPTMGFDDIFSRLARHCLPENFQERAKSFLSEISPELRARNDSFSLDSLPCKTVIKSNCFELNIPSEIFTFSLKNWPKSPWDFVDSISNGKPFVAAPHRNRILAFGLIDQIRDAWSDHLSGSIERTPITDTDMGIENGVINSLICKALVRSFAEYTGIKTDGRRIIWEEEVDNRKQSGGTSCFIHKAAIFNLRYFKESLHLTIRPSVVVLDSQGNELPQEVTKIVKMEILGYQHNNKFNQALEHWRKRIFQTRGTAEFEFPSNSGSTFKFKIRVAPIFSQIGSRSARTQLSIDQRILPLIKQNGIEIPEPDLLFSDKQGTRYISDPHPLRGLQSNRPFDFSLSTHGLATEIRLGVVSPSSESNIFSRYLLQALQIHRPNRTEKDYLIDYPGFQNAFGLDIEVPSTQDASWVECPEPQENIDIPKGALELSKLITQSIDSLVASEKPNVIVIFIPDRWSHWREFKTDQERFDLHDFIKTYCIQKGIATQFIEQSTITSVQQCRIWWWLSVAIYAKAMRTPWVLKALDPDTAFVGLGFSIDRFAPKGQHVVLGCSHLYNAQGEGLQFRLSKVENPIMVSRNPHMSYEDARRVSETIRQLFFESQFRLPSRVVIHKQTRFLSEEKNGLLDGLSGIESVDLLEINIDSALRYVSSVLKQDGNFDEDNFPVRRGSVVQLDNRKALVWCHGVTDAVIRGWRYYQGKRHIPAPLLLQRHAGSTSLESLAAEILGLSKMDWNSADMYSKLPATIDSSRQIARIGTMLQRFGYSSYDYRLFM